MCKGNQLDGEESTLGNNLGMETHSSQSEYSLESHGQGVEKVEETHMVVCCAKLYTDGEESGFCPLNNKYEDMADNEKMEGQTCVEGELGEGKGEGQMHSVGVEKEFDGVVVRKQLFEVNTTLEKGYPQQSFVS